MLLMGAFYLAISVSCGCTRFPRSQREDTRSEHALGCRHSRCSKGRRVEKRAPVLGESNAVSRVILPNSLNPWCDAVP